MDYDDIELDIKYNKKKQPQLIDLDLMRYLSQPQPKYLKNQKYF